MRVKPERRIIPDEERLKNWLVGKARTSNYTGDVFITRKERRMHDRQFLQPRRRERDRDWRTGKLRRRAKSYHGKRELP